MSDSTSYVPKIGHGAPDYVGRIVQNKYRILRKIGEGGMGSVYEAQHVVVGRRFALKFLHPELAARKDAFLRFRREAQAAGALENEHIAAVTDFDVSDDGSPYIVMEYLVGENLGQLLAREGPLPVPRAVALMLQVCRGLEAAHAAGIVHRDLKPDNLFVVRRTDGSEQIKILDFGIAKLESAEAGSSITNTGARMGTPFYMAPEQARGDKDADSRVDIHALGVVLYELLSGEKPHPGDSYNAILAHIISQAPPPLASLRAGVPDGLASVVHRALAFDPLQRQASVRELARELARFGGREIAKLESQFELRVGAANAARPLTPRTPASAASTVGATESASVIGAEPPASAVRRRPWLGLGIGLLLIALAGAFSSLYRARLGESAARSTSAPSTALLPAAPHVPAARLENVRAGASAPVTVPTLAASATPGASAPEHSRGRPEGRPASALRPARTASPSSSVTAGRAENSAFSSSAVPAASSGRRVSFDTNNPYE